MDKDKPSFGHTVHLPYVAKNYTSKTFIALIILIFNSLNSYNPLLIRLLSYDIIRYIVIYNTQTYIHTNTIELKHFIMIQ